MINEFRLSYLSCLIYYYWIRKGNFYKLNILRKQGTYYTVCLLILGY